MVADTHTRYRFDARHAPHEGGPWWVAPVASVDDAVAMVDALLRALAAAGYDGAARGRVRQALEDALLAALEQAPLAPGRALRVSFRVADGYALAEVEGTAAAGTPAPRTPPTAWSRYYAWLRYDLTGELRVCRCWSVP